MKLTDVQSFTLKNAEHTTSTEIYCKNVETL